MAVSGPGCEDFGSGVARRALFLASTADTVESAAVESDTVESKRDPMPLPENDDQILLLHNSRCSKSRAAQALLAERGLEFGERFYLDEPLTRAELEELRVRLDRPVREWTRRGEAAFAETGLGADSDESAWLDAIAAHPILLERPIVIRGAHARVGRPATNVLELFEE